jgi:hypothetical protein
MAKRASIFAAVALAGACGIARAQLAEDQVLVVYDSRIADSKAVAEIYAGSKKVPGGTGVEAGLRPGVWVLDLASTGALMTAPGNIGYNDFRARLLGPIRTYIQSNNLQLKLRCVVTTKGLPHRVMDHDAPLNADFPGGNPGEYIPELTGNDETAASVDTELTLVHQDIALTENGLASDSNADGAISNPFWRATRSIVTQNSTNITLPKQWQGSGTGPYWTAFTGAPQANRLVQGDLVLVSRLDGRTIPQVRAMLERSRNIIIDTNTAAVILDEDGADLDNIGQTFPSMLHGDDYEQTQTALVADRRFSFTFPSAPPNVRYDNNAGAANFFLGPNISVLGGQGILVTNPVILLATYGSNHGGVPTLAGGGSAGTVYASSYNYAPGAIFNTIESFNGRDFGGLGPFFIAQQQAADFIASGGTFAVCNVWEPLADSIPDNLFLTQNFVLGNLCWAEAAWSSIPSLSWMQMVIGDPLARAARSNENLDTAGAGATRITIDDLYAWDQLSGAAPTKDVNRSGIADGADRAIVMATLRASERVNMFSGR